MLHSLPATTDGTAPEATTDPRIREPSAPRPLNHRVWHTRITANRPLIRARHQHRPPQTRHPNGPSAQIPNHTRPIPPPGKPGYPLRRQAHKRIPSAAEERRMSRTLTYAAD